MKMGTGSLQQQLLLEGYILENTAMMLTRAKTAEHFQLAHAWFRRRQT
jgi:hypothetical protein